MDNIGLRKCAHIDCKIADNFNLSFMECVHDDRKKMDICLWLFTNIGRHHKGARRVDGRYIAYKSNCYGVEAETQMEATIQRWGS